MMFLNCHEWRRRCYINCPWTVSLRRVFEVVSIILLCVVNLRVFVQKGEGSFFTSYGFSNVLKGDLQSARGVC